MTNELLDKVKAEFKASLNHLEEELKKVRTGRASVSMLDGITVEAYGSQMPLVAAGSITVPEAQLIQITPFDPGNLQAIAQAIREDQSLGFNPVDDGRVIRIQVPPLTAERRQQLAKQLGEKSEECFIRARNARHEILGAAKKLESDGKITRDDEHRLTKQVDDEMAVLKKTVEDLVGAKEKEILTV